MRLGSAALRAGARITGKAERIRKKENDFAHLQRSLQLVPRGSLRRCLPSRARATQAFYPSPLGPRAAPAMERVSNGVCGDWRLSDGEFLAAWKLPGPNEKPLWLKRENPMPREARIEFEESNHAYTIDGGKKAPRSVTGLVHSYKAKGFDPKEVVVAMKGGKRWSEKRVDYMKASGEESMSEDEITNKWKSNGAIASARGTLLHWHAECHLNGVAVEEPRSPEFMQFLCVEQRLRELGYRAFRTEVCLMHCGLVLAGQLDALFRHEVTGALCLVDWKRTKTIEFGNRFRSLREPLETLDCANGSLYSMQLNVYLG